MCQKSARHSRRNTFVGSCSIKHCSDYTGNENGAKNKVAVRQATLGCENYDTWMQCCYLPVAPSDGPQMRRGIAGLRGLEGHRRNVYSSLLVLGRHASERSDLRNVLGDVHISAGRSAKHHFSVDCNCEIKTRRGC